MASQRPPQLTTAARRPNKQSLPVTVSANYAHDHHETQPASATPIAVFESVQIAINICNYCLRSPYLGRVAALRCSEFREHDHHNLQVTSATPLGMLDRMIYLHRTHRTCNQHLQLLRAQASTRAAAFWLREFVHKNGCRGLLQFYFI